MKKLHKKTIIVYNNYIVQIIKNKILNALDAFSLMFSVLPKNFTYIGKYENGIMTYNFKSYYTYRKI